MKTYICLMIYVLLLTNTVLSQTRYNPSSKTENIEHYAQIESQLPNGSTYIGELGFSVRHPENWVMNSFQVKGSTLLDDFSEWDEPPQFEFNVTLFVFAPEIVDMNEIYDHRLRGNMPMLIVQPTIHEPRGSVMYDVDIDFGARVDAKLNLPEISEPYGNIQGNPIYRSVQLHLLTSANDWKEHQGMYQAMIEFSNTFQYAMHPELQQMFLWWDFYFGYPENWEIEDITSNTEDYRVNIIMSISGTSIEVFVRHPSLGKIDPLQRFEIDQQNIQTFLSDKFILQEEYTNLLHAMNQSGCDIVSPPLYFANNESHGFVRLYRSLELTISVELDLPIEELPLRKILESFFQLSSNACG